MPREGLNYLDTIVPTMSQEEWIHNPIAQKYLSELLGPEGMQVAAAHPEGEITDEELAEELDLEVNTVRRALILLSENNLADYRRVRDEESGWLTYYWTFHYERIPKQLAEEMQRLRDALDERLEYEEQNQFYLCQDCRRRYTFDQAMDFEFNCPECDGDMDAMDSKPLEDAIRDRLDAIEDELQNTDFQ